MRREQLRADIRAAVEGAFVRGPRRFCVRREEVYEVVCAALALPSNNRTRLLVIDVVRTLGGRPIVVLNRRLFSCLRHASMTEAEATAHAKACRADPRGARLGVLHTVPPLPPTARPTPRALEQLRRTWQRRLASEGLGEVDGGWTFGDRTQSRGGLSHRPYEEHHARAEINGAYFDRATALFWDIDRDRQIWQLHALDGLTVREIARRLGLGRDVVHRTMQRLRGQMGVGRRQADGDDEDEEAGAPTPMDPGAGAQR